MARLARLLLARDFSPSSDAALTLSLPLAQALDAEVHVLYADVQAASPFEDNRTAATPLDRLRARVQQRSEVTIQEHGYDPESIRMTHHVKRDTAPAPAIVEYVGEHDIDLVVMGTHGRRGMRRALLGSVAAETIRLAPCPVLTVGPDAERRPIRHILVPVDFSSGTDEAVRYADALAVRLGGHVTLLHVIEDSLLPSRSYGAAASERESTTHEAREKLTRLAEALEAPATFEVHNGRPAPAIEDAAKALYADLIVMPTRGLNPTARLLLGSVTDRVVAGASCPVLTARDFGPYVD